MKLKKNTFMRRYMIQNAYNNIVGLDLDEYNYNYIDYILDDLKYAFNNNKEDYLMNLLSDEACKEIIKISEDYNIFTNDHPLGNQKL